VAQHNFVLNGCSFAKLGQISEKVNNRPRIETINLYTLC